MLSILSLLVVLAGDPVYCAELKQNPVLTPAPCKPASPSKPAKKPKSKKDDKKRKRPRRRIPFDDAPVRWILDGGVA